MLKVDLRCVIHAFGVWETQQLACVVTLRVTDPAPCCCTTFLYFQHKLKPPAAAPAAAAAAAGDCPIVGLCSVTAPYGSQNLMLHFPFHNLYL
jgi:hypothetical protein